MKNSKFFCSFLLFTTACIWGIGFVSQSKGLQYMSPLTFNGFRGLIGSVSLFLYFGIYHNKKNLESPAFNRNTILKAGVSCGLALMAASTFQQFGLQSTSVGKAGFITTLFIIIVPVAGIFLKKKVSGIIWFSAAIAVIGMYLLCITENEPLCKGDLLVLISAFFFALHIILVDFYSSEADPVMISCIQFAVCGILSIAGAFLFESPSPRQLCSGLLPLLYSGILSCAIAYTLQIVGQKGLHPTISALILSLQSVISAIAGFYAYKIGLLKTPQDLTHKQILGCVIIFLSVVLVQLQQNKSHMQKGG